MKRTKSTKKIYDCKKEAYRGEQLVKTHKQLIDRYLRYTRITLDDQANTQESSRKGQVQHRR